MSFTQFVAGLDADQLRTLLGHRADLLVEPVPETPEELAQRCDGTGSLGLALGRMNRDEAVVARTVAITDPADAVTVAARLGATEAEVDGVLDGLAERGLAWRAGDRIGLPGRLAAHFQAELEPFRPLAVITRQARVEDLRTAVHGLGGDPSGLRKPELAARLAELVASPGVVHTRAAALSIAARRHLDLVLGAGGHVWFGGGSSAGERALRAAGLLVDGPYHRPELPREAAAVLLSADRATALTGRPPAPLASDHEVDGRAAAETTLRELTTLLDEAGTHPLARLKKGGVGTRERTRLSTRLGIAEPGIAIDVAAAAGLLTAAAGGYAPTPAYRSWRDTDPAERWACVALAWFDLDLAPTFRTYGSDGSEVAPPQPLSTTAGLVRRALLRAAAGGYSVRAVAEHVDWFCPFHADDDVSQEGGDPTAALRRGRIEAMVREGEALGVISGDRLTRLGEILAVLGGAPDAAAALARRCGELLPRHDGRVVLQSDLTAVVSGQPDAETARLLALCATPEARGAAGVWRFTPAGVRSALDTGLSADQLRADLARMSAHPLPQPLDYLIGDVARRHGTVRLRGARCVLVGPEAEIAELSRTRALRSLHLSELATTVLSSPFEPDHVLGALRNAGFAPMIEDGTGTVILPERSEPDRPPARVVPTRPRVSANELAARLTGGGPGTTRVAGPRAELARLATHLDDVEITLLADAVAAGRDVRITYRNAAGNRSVREIRPQELYGRWLTSWCHLRSGLREFTVAGIESVSPVG